MSTTLVLQYYVENFLDLYAILYIASWLYTGLSTGDIASAPYKIMKSRPFPQIALGIS